MNIAIASVILKSFVAPFKEELERYYPTPLEKLGAVENAASDDGNEEVLEICRWIEEKGLEETFFPPVKGEPDEDPMGSGSEPKVWP